MGIHINVDDRTPDIVNLGERPFLTRVRLRAQRRVLWMRAVWSGDSPAGEQGLAISHTEVDRILSDPAHMATNEPLFYESDPVARHLTEQIREVEAQAAHDAAWTWLRQQFGLSNYEVDLLSLAVAPEVDPQLRRVVGL